METKTAVSLNTEEIKEAVKMYLKNKGHEVETVHFNIEGQEDPTDLFAAMPLTYVLTGAKCE